MNWFLSLLYILLIIQGSYQQHSITKRASLGLSLDCQPHWNDSTDTYTVLLTWRVSNTQLIANVEFFEVSYSEKETSTGNGVSGSYDFLSEVTPKQGSTVFTYSDQNRSPLDVDKLAAYEVQAQWNAPSHDTGTHAVQTVSITPPIPPTPNNVTLLSHYVTTHNISPLHIAVVLNYFKLSWNIMSSQNLNYYLCVENQKCFSIHNVTQIDTTSFVGTIIHPGTLILNRQTNVIKIKIHSSYTVESDDNNITINSTFSSPVNLSLSSSIIPSPSTTSFTTSSTGTIPSYYYTTTSNLIITTDTSNTLSADESLYATTLITSSTVILSSPIISNGSTTDLLSSPIISNSSTVILSSPTISNGSTTGLLSTPNSSSVMLQTGLIVAIIAVGLIVLLVIIVTVIGLMVLIVSRNRKKFKDISDYLEHDGPDDMMAIIFNNSTQPTVTITQAELSPQTDEWEIPMEAIQFDQVLGEGCFGEVFLGSLTEEFNNQALTSYLRQTEGRGFVAIKLLKSTASSSEKNDFLKEIELMKKISQGKNARVVNMLGAVTIQEPMILVTEFVIHGDLLSYLRACRKKSVFHRGAELKDEMSLIDGNDLLSFGYQITSGMEYLSSLQVVHRDLACRNILVGEGKNLKITDFGMSRMIYNDSAYVKTTKGKLPLKWMSIESIVDRIFTSSSDVWSFGICLWEIATLGHTPYPTVANEQLLPMLMQGYRMEKPNKCSDEIYDIMLLCWEEDPTDRPTFIVLRNKFDIILSKQQNFNEHYIDLSVDSDQVLPSEESKCSSNESSTVTVHDLEHNVYVDSPTHVKNRPYRLSLPTVPSLLEGTSSPGGISLPPGCI